MLATALQIAARKVTSPAPGANNDRRMVWGVQVDAALATDAENGRRLTAAYLAKYATKGSDEHGVLDHGHPSTNFAQDEVEFTPACQAGGRGFEPRRSPCSLSGNGPCARSARGTTVDCSCARL